MLNLYYADGEYIVLNGINDAVSALTDPVPFLSRQPFATGRSGISGQPLNSTHYLYGVFLGYRTEIFLDGLFEINLICGHLSLAF